MPTACCYVSRREVADRKRSYIRQSGHITRSGTLHGHSPGRQWALPLEGSLTGLDVQRRYLWKSFRGKSNTIPGRAEKCSASARNPVRHHPGIVFGISPERCSASPRNPVRLAPESPDTSTRLLTRRPGSPGSSRRPDHPASSPHVPRSFHLQSAVGKRIGTSPPLSIDSNRYPSR